MTPQRTIAVLALLAATLVLGACADRSTSEAPPKWSPYIETGVGHTFLNDVAPTHD